ncbi:MAG: hypothetical protein CBD02_00325 [Candidatus Pelagibacter sp. TMED142]|nr:MAG: hypothetical protein CBD02_00325 [Candidatus Pelagibacter sp. TMED142]|tara:strand:+ start:6137 stop:6712 length:576 start_codon:yes stop_codon:yes gene_type:complete
MAQKSDIILASKSHLANVTGTDISFTATGTEYKISSTSTSLAGFNVRDLITVTGSSSNNSTFTVKSEVSANELIVEEVVTTETSDGSTTTTLDHTGFVSAKVKGDGYYNKPDGVHTVAYQVDSTMAGSIKMQGSLATTPTEDDYFDITGTTFTADQSTLISTANFTGNFVWIRAKATSVTAGTISSILVNS